jgi:hypothetical protein
MSFIFPMVVRPLVLNADISFGQNVNPCGYGTSQWTGRFCLYGSGGLAGTRRVGHPGHGCLYESSGWDRESSIGSEVWRGDVTRGKGCAVSA